MEKQRWEESGGEEKKWEDQRRERVRRKKMPKVGKSRFSVFFPMIGGSGGSKSRLAKAAGAEPCAQWEIKNCTPLWREAQFQIKMFKAHHSRTTLGSWDVAKVRPTLVRSTYPSQHVQSTLGSDHFWKLTCRKSAPHFWREARIQVNMYKAH